MDTLEERDRAAIIDEIGVDHMAAERGTFADGRDPLPDIIDGRVADPCMPRVDHDHDILDAIVGHLVEQMEIAILDEVDLLAAAPAVAIDASCEGRVEEQSDPKARS